MIKRNEGPRTKRFALMGAALTSWVLIALPATAQESTAFQDWIGTRKTEFGFRIDAPAFAPEMGFANGEIALVFDQATRGKDAVATIERAFTQHCEATGGKVSAIHKGWACGNHGSEWLLLESIKPVRSGVMTGILRSMHGGGGTMDDLLSDRKASNYTAWLLEAPPGQREHSGFRQAMSQRGRVSVPALEAERLRQEARIEAERPRKLLVGTRICKKQGIYDWLGFTEAYSPQTGKIQIRVSGTTNGFKPGGWQPELIWEHPDYWRVCE